MPDLVIKGVKQDPSDKSGQSFVLSFERELYYFELETVPKVLSAKFAPTVVTGVSWVTIRNANKDFFTNPESQANLKALVAEAAAEADRLLTEQRTAAAQKARQAEDANRELGEIDWSS